MKAAQYFSTENIKISDVQKPDIVEGEALIKVSYTGVCGTDMMIYSGKHPRAVSPLIMGHEFSGVIENIKGNSNFKKGDCVTVEPTISCGQCKACLSGSYHVCENLKLIGIDMDGGFAEYVRVPIHRLHIVPDNLSMELAALAEPLAVAVHTVRRSTLKVGQDVVILGAGPIGLLIGIVARMNGANNIFISDISEFRLNKAKKLGFHAINDKKMDSVNEIMKKTNGRLIDVVFETAGIQKTVDQAVNIIKTQGKIVIVSVFKTNPKISLADMHFREISLTTTRCYSSDDFKTAIDIMSSEKIDFSIVISHELPINQVGKAFSLMKNTEDSLKVLVKQ